MPTFHDIGTTDGINIGTTDGINIGIIEINGSHPGALAKDEDEVRLTTAPNGAIANNTNRRRVTSGIGTIDASETIEHVRAINHIDDQKEPQYYMSRRH
jgi:hypothetical protein